LNALPIEREERSGGEQCPLAFYFYFLFFYFFLFFFFLSFCFPKPTSGKASARPKIEGAVACAPPAKHVVA
jgi:hypothetical protein